MSRRAERPLHGAGLLRPGRRALKEGWPAPAARSPQVETATAGGSSPAGATGKWQCRPWGAAGTAAGATGPSAERRAALPLANRRRPRPQVYEAAISTCGLGPAVAVAVAVAVARALSALPRPALLLRAERCCVAAVSDSHAAPMNTRTALVAVSAVTILGALYFFHAPPSPALTGMASAATAVDAVPGLEFKLSQISRNPPSLLVTLKNTNPSSPFTILKWGTPLDPQAANLGVFKLVDTETGKDVPVPVIKINRKMPPSQEDLVTVAPGTEEATEVVFNKAWMPEKRPAKYKVKAEGAFGAVWDRYGGLTESDLEAYSESPLSGRTFSTNEVSMRVE